MITLFLLFTFINYIFSKNSDYTCKQLEKTTKQGRLIKKHKEPLNIRFNTTNNIMIKGTINNDLSSKFVYELQKIKNKKNIYVYLNTPGGSIDDGMQIVALVKKYKLSCIAEKAYSMGFIIFQSCNKRYIMPHSRLMQHQLSYGIQNEKLKIDSYVNFVNAMEKQLVKEQADRIGLHEDEFYKKTINEWWLYGNDIINEKCADKLVNVECSVTLTKQNYTLNIGSYEYVYSRCPLVDKYIYKNKTTNSPEPFIFTF